MKKLQALQRADVSCYLFIAKSNYKGNNSNKSNSKRVDTFSFANKEVKSLINQYKESVAIERNIYKYMNKYAVYTGQQHPKLKLKQWQQVVDKIVY